MSATPPTAGTILESGLWSNNTGLVQLLGLCPLLAVSNGAVNAIALGLATVLALTTTNLAISLLRPVIRDEVRIPAFVLVIASVVTAIELAMNAWLHPLYEVLGLFIPLIVTNCAVLGRAEAFASRNAPHRAALDGFAIGLGFLVVLAVIGAIREITGRGTLFAGASSLLGPWAASLETTIVPDYRGFLIAVLPTGAFFVLAALIAAKNAIDARRARPTASPRFETAAEPAR
jgi:electron transport complex protein RnfE